MKGILYILLSLITHIVLAQNSVLNAGQWYKIGVTNNGVYKIDYDFLQNAGISLNNIDPRHIRLYGNGGGMLPQPNNASRPADLQENAIFVQGEGDGSFDTQDYILFYGQSPDQLSLDSVGTPFYQKHLYSDTAYYFLTIADVPGQRIETQENVGGSYPIITTFDELIAHELDEEKVIISGREWYGERFASGQTQNFTFERAGIQENTDIDIIVNVLNRALGEASFEVALNGTSLGSIPLEAVSEGTYTRKGKEGQKLFTANSNALGGSSSLNVNLRFSGGSGSAGSIGHLNRMLIKAQRHLALYGAQTIFRSLGSLNHNFSTFELKNTAPSLLIWDITDPLAPKNQTIVSENGSVKFSVATQVLREFIAFQNSDFLQPVFVQPVSNQNLHGTSVPEMLIISHVSLQSEAERLAAFRTQHDGLEVAVVNIAQIFNEFSSGAQDVTAIRDFVKYLYDQNPEKLKYLLLFGKGTYDYKSKVDGNINLIPTYESYNSLDPVYSFSSDDYFGLLEAEEGSWEESLEGESTLEIGIGRLPVKNVQEAKAVVNKLIRYDSAPESLGKWRNTVFFVADDGDSDRHQKDADFLARFVDTAYTTFNVNKIYLDAFPQQSQASGEIAPLVNQQIDEAIEKGALIINYTGHGGELGWAEERILNLEMINKWKNKYQLPFFVTATCEFGRHDDPRRVSGAEQLVLHENGGAIGLVTTARPVFSSTNFKLNSAFYQKVFRKENGQYPTLGEIFRFTKNENKVDRVNRNFSLLGDPSMRLAYAKSTVVLDMAEDLTTGIQTDTLKAQSKIKIYGHVSEQDSDAIAVNFNGTVEVVIYDKPETIKTLGNAGTTMQFEQRNRIIHRGQASVKSGKFTLSFIVPKNINYQKDFGKLSLYAWEGTKANLLQDASGAITSLVIGGSNKNIIPDNNPPLIELFMDDTSFVSGAVIGNNTRLLARFTDENGINVSQNSLGQNIVAILKHENSEEVQAIILNDFYITDLDTYASGKIMYPLPDLKEGNYTLEVKAWDTYNNAGNASIAFTVVSENSLKISEFINYPNPVQTQTTFRIAHNRAGDDLAVSISIYNIQGEIINTFNAEYINADARLDDMVWYGTNATGHRLRPGIYLARVLVKSLQDGTKNEKYRKLIIIN